MLPNVSLSRRIHSPSLPDLWVPPVRFPPAPAVQSPPRPSVGPLDVASPPAKASLPLTPPLTPASARPADPSELSPLLARSSRSNSLDIAHCFTPYAFPPHAADFSPVSQWSSSDSLASLPSMHASSRLPSEHAPRVSFPTADALDASLLPSPTSPTRPTHPPRALDPASHSEHEHEHDAQPPSRFLFISGVPKSATSQDLKQAFLGWGDLKGIFVRFQAEHGVIILAFFDIRHTTRAHRQISTHAFFDGVRLSSRFISAQELRNLIGQSNFVNQNDGELSISTSFVGPEIELDAPALQNVLASFGDLRSFSRADAHANARARVSLRTLPLISPTHAMSFPFLPFSPAVRTPFFFFFSNLPLPLRRATDLPRRILRRPRRPLSHHRPPRPRHPRRASPPRPARRRHPSTRTHARALPPQRPRPKPRV
ncbi:hypothetical protein K439DRAFT_958245 [Ramaria rubella]|nr:hypothetical protein K439DRAFT_958245 [Ramaria rubella]